MEDLENMDNYDDIFQNNDDGIGDNVRLDDDTIRDHAIHDEKYDKFLVPIYLTENEESSLNGNGVIVDKYLITAAHVAYGKKDKKKIPELFYKFNGEWCKVSDNMLVHDGREVPDKGDIHDDLIIYELEQNYDSFMFCEDDWFINTKLGSYLHLRTYKYDEQKNVIISDDNNFPIISYTVAFTPQKKWNNCFTIDNIYELEHGNSGSALTINNVLYGILVSVILPADKQIRNCRIGYAVMNAVYIKEIITKKNKKQNLTNE